MSTTETSLATAEAAVYKLGEGWTNIDSGRSNVTIYQGSTYYRIVGISTINNSVSLNVNIYKDMEYSEASDLFHQFVAQDKNTYGLNFASKEGASNFAATVRSAIKSVGKPPKEKKKAKTSEKNKTLKKTKKKSVSDKSSKTVEPKEDSEQPSSPKPQNPPPQPPSGGPPQPPPGGPPQPPSGGPPQPPSGGPPQPPSGGPPPPPSGGPPPPPPPPPPKKGSSTPSRTTNLADELSSAKLRKTGPPPEPSGPTSSTAPQQQAPKPKIGGGMDMMSELASRLKKTSDTTEKKPVTTAPSSSSNANTSTSTSSSSFKESDIERLKKEIFDYIDKAKQEILEAILSQRS